MIKIRGLESVEHTLKEIAPKHALNIMRATVGALAADVRKEAKSNAPSESGTLKREIKVKRRQVKGGIIRVDVVVGGKAFYWRFQEYGTSELPEQAFFMKAIATIENDLGPRLDALFTKKFTATLARERKKLL